MIHQWLNQDLNPDSGSKDSPFALFLCFMNQLFFYLLIPLLAPPPPPNKQKSLVPEAAYVSRVHTLSHLAVVATGFDNEIRVVMKGHN